MMGLEGKARSALHAAEPQGETDDAGRRKRATRDHREVEIPITEEMMEQLGRHADAKSSL